MKSAISIILSSLFAVLFVTVGLPAYPQTATSAPAYLYREYMKVEPDKEVDYIKLEQTWKKVHTKRKAQGNILDWALYRRVFPSGTNAVYDYMTVTAFATAAKYHAGNAMTWDYIVQIMDESDMGTMENTDKIRKIVERCMDVDLEYLQTDGRFIQITRLAAKPGSGAELRKMEAMMKPVFAEAAKMGKIASWRFGQRLYPIDSESGNYYRVITSNNLDDMFKGTDVFLETAFKKVYPTKNFQTTIGTFRDMITILNVELWESMDRTR